MLDLNGVPVPLFLYFGAFFGLLSFPYFTKSTIRRLSFSTSLIFVGVLERHLVLSVKVNVWCETKSISPELVVNS